MSPSKHHNDQRARIVEINGLRPSPLKINKASHLIHKFHAPVIIYTHSPKIIHAQAHDFMALVQKLTGNLPNTVNETKTSSTATTTTSYLSEQNDHNDTLSSAVTDDHCYGDSNSMSCYSDKSRMMFKSSTPCFADIPLFTPISNDLFCSPTSYFRFTGDTVFESPNKGGLISPSLIDFMKGLREELI